MRLINKDDLMQKLGISEECNSQCPRYGTIGCKEDSAFVYACECITDAEVLTIDMIGDKLDKKEVAE